MARSYHPQMRIFLGLLFIFCGIIVLGGVLYASAMGAGFSCGFNHTNPSCKSKTIFEVLWSELWGADAALVWSVLILMFSLFGIGGMLLRKKSK